MKLNKTERKWLNDFQKLMNNCPSERFSAYTIGDNEIVIIDADKENQINDLLDKGDVLDFCVGASKLDAVIERIGMPFVVNSTAG
ncbi:hypothetical protein JCM30760_26800 [Thiomicrorhabdus hydrogeniphila]